MRQGKKHLQKNHRQSKEEEPPKRKKKYHKRQDVKDKLKNWEDNNWEEYGSDNN